MLYLMSFEMKFRDVIFMLRMFGPFVKRFLRTNGRKMDGFAGEKIDANASVVS